MNRIKKETFVFAASSIKNWTLLQIHNADWSVTTPGYCSNVPVLLKVTLNDKKKKKNITGITQKTMYDIHL